MTKCPRSWRRKCKSIPTLCFTRSRSTSDASCLANAAFTRPENVRSAPFGREGSHKNVRHSAVGDRWVPTSHGTPNHTKRDATIVAEPRQKSREATRLLSLEGFAAWRGFARRSSRLDIRFLSPSNASIAVAHATHKWAFGGALSASNSFTLRACRALPNWKQRFPGRHQAQKVDLQSLRAACDWPRIRFVTSNPASP